MEKYDNNGKGGYFRFDDDNKMGYEYILSIIWPHCGLVSHMASQNLVCIGSVNGMFKRCSLPFIIAVFPPDYQQATFRQYQRLTKQMKPNMDEYEREKDKM